MAEEKDEIEIAKEDKKVHASKMKKGRKTIGYLQECKDQGKKIVQMCPANRDQYFTMAAEMAGCDICRLTTPGENVEMQIANAPWWIRTVRAAAQIIHINFVMQTPTHSSKEDALRDGSIYMNNGADSLLPMGVNN
jgi:3-methyl-2-oxobutanoate hydroxymethyltransferase